MKDKLYSSTVVTLGFLFPPLRKALQLLFLFLKRKARLRRVRIDQSYQVTFSLHLLPLLERAALHPYTLGWFTSAIHRGPFRLNKPG